jgi:hypothetical protein
LYVKGKHNDYTNGTATYTHEQIILLAFNKYNLLMQEGIFGAKSLEEEKIIAMQAELMALNGSVCPCSQSPMHRRQQERWGEEGPRQKGSAKGQEEK